MTVGRASATLLVLLVLLPAGAARAAAPSSQVVAGEHLFGQ